MSSLSVFDFETNQVRVVVIDGESWFLASDLCKILEIKNVSDALSRLDNDERKLLKNNSIATNGGLINQSLNPNQEVALINESGMYSLTLTSRKPEAKRFKKWITSEVLPKLRKDGKYEMEEKPTLPQTYLEALKALVASEEEKQLALKQVDKLTTLLDNEVSFASIVRVSKHLGISETNFSWRPLKAATLALGSEPKKVPCPRYNYKLLYPIRAFEQCYPQYDLTGLEPEAYLSDFLNDK